MGIFRKITAFACFLLCSAPLGAIIWGWPDWGEPNGSFDRAHSHPSAPESDAISESERANIQVASAKDDEEFTVHVTYKKRDRQRRKNEKEEAARREEEQKQALEKENPFLAMESAFTSGKSYWANNPDFYGLFVALYNPASPHLSMTNQRYDADGLMVFANVWVGDVPYDVDVNACGGDRPSLDTFLVALNTTCDLSCEQQNMARCVYFDQTATELGGELRRAWLDDADSAVSDEGSDRASPSLSSSEESAAPSSEQPFSGYIDLLEAAEMFGVFGAF